jgi:hypothetical protein
MIAPWPDAIPQGQAAPRHASGRGEIDTSNTSNTSNTLASDTSISSDTATAKNIVADFGATCNGVADDAPAFAVFNTWARAQTVPVQLTIPSGRTCQFISAAGMWWAAGIKNLLVIGYGATISDSNATGSGFQLGGMGIKSGNGNFGYTDSWTARVASVSAGSTSVTLLNPTRASIFSVGSWALITGFDLMGYGNPPNPHFFEYVQITAINGGQITFAAPLNNSYESTWPLYWSGQPGLHPDQGGPATLYALDSSWDLQVEYRGLTIDRRTAQTYANGRSVTYRDVTFTGQACGIPTQNLIWQAINTNMSDCGMEADKLVGTVVLNGVTIRQMQFQSSSIDLLNMSNTTVTNALAGTPKKAVISNSTISTFRPGAYAYGRSDEVSCTNCIISNLNPLGILETKGGAGVNNVYTMSSGIITIPGSDGPVAWAVPGTNLMWAGARNSETAFRVVDVTQDASNTYVKTTLAGGFPPVPTYHGALYIQVHPAPKFTCVSCTGNPDVVDLSQAGAQGQPLYSYSKRTYAGVPTGTQRLGNPGTNGMQIWGKLSSLTVSVTSPYRGGLGALTAYYLTPYDNYPTIKSNYSIFYYGPGFDLKAAGQRVITPTAVTGGQTNDIGLPVPEAVWFTGTTGVITSADISAECAAAPSVCPTMTIEIITDQGVVNP